MTRQTLRHAHPLTGTPLTLVPPAKAYEDYLADGRVWGAEKLAGAVWKGSHDVESLARIYAEVNAPVAVRKDWVARMAAVRAAEFGPSATESGQFALGQYGLRRTTTPARNLGFELLGSVK